MSRVVQLWDEDTQSRPGDARRTLKWWARGFADPIAAENAVRAECPPYYKDLPLVELSGPRAGSDGWTFTATFAAKFEIAPAAPPFVGPPPPGPPPPPPPPPPPGVPPPPPTPTAPSDSTKLTGSSSFTVGGGTTRLRRSFKTILRRDEFDDEAEFLDRNIGLTAQGKVEGVEVFAPKFEWSASFEPTSVTHKYVKTVGGLVGRVNRANFYARGPEECLLVKVSGQWQSGERWKVTYDFWDQYTETLYENTPENEAAHPDAELLPEGLAIASIERIGWHYLWFRIRTTLAGTEMTERPYAVYVERVYRTGDFSKLEIG